MSLSETTEQGNGEDCITWNFMICTAHQKLFGLSTRRTRWAEHVECVGDRSGAYRVLVGIPKRKRPLGKKNIYTNGLNIFYCNYPPSGCSVFF